MTSLVAQTVKHLSTMWETWVQSLGQENPLEKEMAIHSSTVAWISNVTLSFIPDIGNSDVLPFIPNPL